MVRTAGTSRLADASPAHLAEVELLGAGEALHWETLDVDYSIAGLVNGIFGTARWMAARAGRATSPAKAEAARANGGRPSTAGPERPTGSPLRRE